MTASSGTSLISAEAERQATVPVGTEGKGAAYGPAATAELNGPVGSKEVGRPGKALLAAAAIAGVLLISVPFLIAVGDGGRTRCERVTRHGARRWRHRGARDLLGGLT